MNAKQRLKNLNNQINNTRNKLVQQLNKKFELLDDLQMEQEVELENIAEAIDRLEAGLIKK